MKETWKCIKVNKEKLFHFFTDAWLAFHIFLCNFSSCLITTLTFFYLSDNSCGKSLPACKCTGFGIVVVGRPIEERSIVWNLVVCGTLLCTKVLWIGTCLHVTEFISHGFSFASLRMIASSKLYRDATIASSGASRKFRPSSPA
jgi:hypothetical protein